MAPSYNDERVWGWVGAGGALPSSAAGIGVGGAVGAIPSSDAGTGGGDGEVGARPCAASPLAKREGVEAILCAFPPGGIVAGWEVKRTLPCSARGAGEFPILLVGTGFSSRRTGTGGKGSVAVHIGAAR